MVEGTGRRSAAVAQRWRSGGSLGSGLDAGARLGSRAITPPTPKNGFGAGGMPPFPAHNFSLIGPQLVLKL